ncbi:VWA domain-containing protein [Vreelandella massiliensis]|uniref:VWA domain-containing protein n=1 Tax=Vreelandella massiliensis TaxID=1816686 RepID=UPI00096AB67C|nr:VWA domain-containing protein [Halomonas massiliensis]
MSKQASTLQKALPIVAAAYGRKLGVKVAIGNDDSSAYTDGETIVVPNISSDYPKDVIWGYLAHEASHVRFTNFNVRRIPGAHAALTNIIEDARIEREMAQAYPGVAKELDAIWHYLKKAGYVQDVSDETPAIGILQMYCLYFLRCNYLKQTMLQDALKKAEAALCNTFQKGARIRLKGLLSQVPTLTSTRGAADLAEQIMDMLEEEANNPSETDDADDSNDSSDDGDTDESNSADDTDDAQSETSSDEDDQASDDSTSSGESDDASDGDDSDAAGSDGSSEAEDSKADDNTSGNAGDDEGDDESDSSGGANGQSDDADTSDNDSKSTNSAEGDGEEDANGDSTTKPSGSGDGDVDQDKAQTNTQQVLSAGRGDELPDPMRTLRADMDAETEAVSYSFPVTIPDGVSDTLLVEESGLGQGIKNHVHATSHKLQHRLAGLVQATQRQAVRPSRRGKRINTKNLARMAVGDTRVFSAKDRVKKPNAAIHILVDMSGSMCMSQRDVPFCNVENVDDFTEAFAEVDSTHRWGVRLPFQVARNATLALTQALERIKGVNVAATGFSSVNDITPMLKHGETLNHKTIQRFAVHPVGTTALAEALWYSAVELNKTQEERKVLIVLSDGSPDSPLATHQAIKQLSKSVELVGIGILDDAIVNYIDNSTVVNELGELEKTLMDVARASILK